VDQNIKMFRLVVRIEAKSTKVKVTQKLNEIENLTQFLCKIKEDTRKIC
jgi:hypothetical protein